MREEDERYFERIETRLEEAFDVAERARASGGDPEPTVEIPLAQDMADRVENLLGIPDLAVRIRELEAEMSREEAALELAREFAEGRVGDFETREGKVEGAVRTAVALLTEGVVAAPIEGIDRVELDANDDGTEFVRVYYAGPIRSAGGTAQALSVLVADYTRALLGIEAYRPRPDEVERYVEEVALYDTSTGLQYSPSAAETRFIARHCPIMLDGEATGDDAVSGYRDLDRIDTNNARGGMCLVLAEGIALKAPKIERYTSNLEEVDWPWIADLIAGDVGEDADEEPEGQAAGEAAAGEASLDASSTGRENGEDPAEREGPPRVDPAEKYLRDLIAGRPVFAHPSRPGGFRLRYGRARNHGFATAGVHPATMHLLDDFLATGTQIKTERPGKAAGVVPVDSIEGPTVRLATGEVRRIDDVEEAIELRGAVDEILDVGEYLVNVGEFIENNHPLAPASYVYEWWVQEFERAGADVQALRDDPHVDLRSPTAARAIEWATDYDAPLHPAYTYLWHDIDVEAFEALADACAAGTVRDGVLELAIPDSDRPCDVLEALLVPHRREEDRVTIEAPAALLASLGCAVDGEDVSRQWHDLPDRVRSWPNAVPAVNEVAPFTVRERAPTRIGNRMGRPEKSERRELSPAVHTLFPLGEAGGDQRDVMAASRAGGADGERGEIEVELGRRRCGGCGETTFSARCPACGERTTIEVVCPDCDRRLEADESGRTVCPRCERRGTSVEEWTVALDERVSAALEAVGEREGSFEILKGVKGLTSEAKTPEPIEKGILRAKHGVSMFKDGTIRYDMTDLPVTAVTPAELSVSVERFLELGYETDLDGEPLEHDDQLVGLKVQDVVLSSGAAEHLLRTADFVDDLLERYYDLEPFYGVEERDDLVGELVFGMAPHTSAAVVGRVVGFTDAAVGYAHPFFHAAKRRNCFHPETTVWYEDEGGVWRHERIERLVEERLEDPHEDDFGVLIEELDGDLLVPSIDGDGAVVRRPVRAVSKHPAPAHLVRIETRSGRELTVTPDHELLVFDGDGLASKRASEVGERDALVRPRRLDVVDPCTDPPTVDLLEPLIASGNVGDDLVIEGLGRDTLSELFESTLAGERDGTVDPIERTAAHLGVTTRELAADLERDGFPVDRLLAIFDSSEEFLDRVPDDVTLGMEGDSSSIDRHVEVNEPIAALLGYDTASGFATEPAISRDRPPRTIMGGSEVDAPGSSVEVLRDEFGVVTDGDVGTANDSSRLVRTAFDALETGQRADDQQRVPQWLFDAPDELVAAYLAGYFDGAGAPDENGNEVHATTTGQAFKEDVLALLTRLGIDASVVHGSNLGRGPSSSSSEDAPSKTATSYHISIGVEDAMELAAVLGSRSPRSSGPPASHAAGLQPTPRSVFDGGSEAYLVDGVATVEHVASDVDATYCLTVADTHSLVVNDTFQRQCDGDEDCVMLLMDGLLNFSKAFLPSSRGGRMDAPLVMSSRIDPAEIDDEAHNIDLVDRYPLEFYEATLAMADPDEVYVETAEARVGTPSQYAPFAHTHETSDIALGPALSAYKTLGSMMDKMEAQLALARKLRAVDETDVAERVIEYHFLPDLIGNLRAFSSQEVRCHGCGAKYRRVPLAGTCLQCGGNLTLTVHQGSVNKYMDVALRIADEFGCREYTKQRLRILERSLESVFEDDTNKQSGIADFM